MEDQKIAYIFTNQFYEKSILSNGNRAYSHDWHTAPDNRDAMATLFGDNGFEINCLTDQSYS